LTHFLAEFSSCHTRLALGYSHADEAIAMARSEIAATAERELAAKFWRLVSNAAHVSESFRKIATAHAAALTSLNFRQQPPV
jgi:ribosomal protein L16 Arg81 hydroxylase